MNDWVLKPVQFPHVVTQHHLLWQTKVLRKYSKSRSQLRKVDQVRNGNKEKKKRKTKKEMARRSNKKNGTQTRWHIKPSCKY